jgi:histidinol-phosphate/aromatic aminotransferase/cobyric acid decarboxylase-like protein
MSNLNPNFTLRFAAAERLDVRGLARGADFLPGKWVEGAQMSDMVHRLNDNTVPWPLPKEVQKEMARATRKYGNRYTLANWAVEIREAASKAFGFPYPERIVYFPEGSGHALQQFTQAYHLPGDHALIPQMGFAGNEIAPQQAGVRVRHIPHILEVNGLNAQYRTQFGQVSNLITQYSPNAIYLDTPCNPSGYTASADELSRVIDQMRRRGVVGLDTAYAGFAGAEYERMLVNQVQGNRHVVMFKSMSKEWGGAGLRGGFLLLPEGADAAMLGRFNSVAPPNVASMAGTIELLKHPEHKAMIYQKVVAWKAEFTAMMHYFGLTTIQGGNFVSVIPGPMANGREISVFQMMKATILQKVIALPLNVSYGEDVLRVTAGNRGSLLALKRAFSSLATGKVAGLAGLTVASLAGLKVLLSDKGPTTQA